jgi:hypothetical protein
MSRLPMICLAVALSQGCFNSTRSNGFFVNSVQIVGGELVVEKCMITWSVDTDEANSSECKTERHRLPGRDAAPSDSDSLVPAASDRDDAPTSAAPGARR